MQTVLRRLHTTSASGAEIESDVLAAARSLECIFWADDEPILLDGLIRSVCWREGVAEAAVVGVPDAILGLEILLTVTLDDNSTVGEREIRAHCAHCLEDFMQSKYVQVVPDLPRTDNGKINKGAIALQYHTLCAAS